MPDLSTMIACDHSPCVFVYLFVCFLPSRTCLSHIAQNVVDKLARAIATRDAAAQGRLRQVTLARGVEATPTTRPTELSSGRSTERSKEQSTENDEEDEERSVGSATLGGPGPSGAEYKVSYGQVLGLYVENVGGRFLSTNATWLHLRLRCSRCCCFGCCCCCVQEYCMWHVQRPANRDARFARRSFRARVPPAAAAAATCTAWLRHVCVCMVIPARYLRAMPDSMAVAVPYHTQPFSDDST